MMRRIFIILGLLGAGLFTVPSQAFTYVPMTDAALLDQSPVVVLGQVQAVDGAGVLNRPVTEYQLAVQQVLKGEVPVNVITVQIPGSPAPSAYSHWLPGMPGFEPGEAVLLFLQPAADGRYRLMQLGLGAFRLRQDARGNNVFVRQLAHAQRLEVSPPRANAMAEQPRDAEAFIAELGGSLNLDELQTGNMRQTANFTTMGTPPSRWFDFDAGRSVPFLAHSGGQPGMSAGGFTEFRNAINAWNNDAGSNIRYNYAGTTSIRSSFADTDGVNSILFDDPNGEVDGSFNCQQGGVLAAGGFVSTVGTRIYNGTLFAEIIEADIITNDGAGCFFGSFGGKGGEQIFAHELGHTLGLGHSCGDDPVLVINDCTLATPEENDALMRYRPHDDGRGASLRADDRAGIAFLYADTGEVPDDGGSSGGDDGNKKANKGSSGGGGGCAVHVGGSPDPVLWLLVLMAVLYLTVRRHRSID